MGKFKQRSPQNPLSDPRQKGFHRTSTWRTNSIKRTLLSIEVDMKLLNKSKWTPGILTLESLGRNATVQTIGRIDIFDEMGNVTRMVDDETILEVRKFDFKKIRDYHTMASP